MAAYSLLVVIGCGLFAGPVELSKCPQMIAFTPGSESQVAAPGHSVRLAGEGYAQAVNDVSASTRFRAVNTVAAMPSVLSRSVAGASGNVSVATKRHGAAQENRGRAISSRAYEPLLADVSIVDSSVVVEQQWIVLTSWEQVNPASRAAAAPSLQKDSEGDEQTEAHANSRPVQHSFGQATITQLVVRILPAGFKFDRPDAGRVNNGWLVLQL